MSEELKRPDNLSFKNAPIELKEDGDTRYIEAVFSLSKIGSQEIPPLFDFHKPPDAVPTYITSGLLITTSIAVTRPDIPPGPMFLGFRSCK